MAKQIIDRIITSIGETTFDIELNSPVVAIGGDSGTGKTFLLRTLIAASRLGNLKVPFNWIDASLMDTTAKLVLSNTKDSLLVIDNADLLLRQYGITAKDILSNKNTNQYLIFSREGTNYGASIGSIGCLVTEGNTVKIEYLE